MTRIPIVPWYLNCEPREAQIEALSRSVYGVKTRDHWLDPQHPEQIQSFDGSPYKGWGHFLEMRVGKTPTALNEFLILKNDFEFTNKMLIMTPNKYKLDWGKEAERFGITDLPIHIFESKHRKHAVEFVKKYNRPTINFALLYKHCVERTKQHAKELF